ncbi:MAG: DUF4345 domain-containing protein [Gemmataceae bacterium]|nr:DUF4345 domain-containing protein [Gemmata sp.]MDW8197101.1 DUF4345 domain-containing protein [Gemmataceae bacterium]
MNFPRGVLLVCAAAFLVFGVWGCLASESMLALVDVVATTATARADVRAQYGGFTLGMGLFLLMCVWRPSWTGPGLVASGCTLTGFAAARWWVIFTDEPVSPTISALALSEACGAVLSWIAWRMDTTR